MCSWIGSDDKCTLLAIYRVLVFFLRTSKQGICMLCGEIIIIGVNHISIQEKMLDVD